MKGIQYDKIKNDFMFYRLPMTKDYMKSKINDNDIFIYSIIGKDIYEWKNGENIYMDLERQPINLPMDIPKTILIHVRKKGVDDDFYHTLINKIIENGCRCVLIGHPKEINFTINHSLVIDLRGKLTLSEIFDYIKNTEYMVGSSSMFTYHRWHFNKPTIILTPESSGCGANEYAIRKEYLNNKKYLFLNSDSDCYKEVEDKVMEWINGRM